MQRLSVFLTTAMCLALTAMAPLPAIADGPRAHKPPARLQTLPRAHHKVVHRGKTYYFTGGRFYRANKGAFISIAAPIGAIIPALPNGYVTVSVGLNRYYYYAGVYYRAAAQGFVVTEQPEEAEAALSTSGSDKLIIYPAAGQSDEQRGRDKYECHVWASDESGFDPTSEESDPRFRADYQRALGACLEARDYVVK